MSVSSFVAGARRRGLRLEDAVHALCQRYSVAFLRIALGAVFVLFGVLKFFPNLSPAQAIAEMTTRKLTLGLVPAQSLLYFVAVVEVSAGLLLITNRAMRFALWLLAFEMLAILSPLVLLTGELFSGPHHLPNLLGQYILKDFVLFGAVLTLFANQRASLTANTRPAKAPAKRRRAANVAGHARQLRAETGLRSAPGHGQRIR